MSDEKKGRPTGSCEAHGCPLPGAIHRGSGWWCFVHFGVDCDLQATTQRIHRNIGAFKIVMRASNISLRVWDESRIRWIDQTLTKIGAHGLVPKYGEGRGAWVSRARNILRNDCFVSREQTELEGMKQGKTDALAEMKKFASYAPAYDPDARAHLAEEEIGL